MSSKTKTIISPLLKPLREPSQKSMIALSTTMVVFAMAGLLTWQNDVPGLFDEKEKPLLAAGRDETQNGQAFIANRMKDGPFIYGLAHIFPAMIWSVLIPTQHMSYIRRNYGQFHMIAGWLVTISAITLSISGSLLPLFNLSYSDPDLWHLHYLLIPTQVLPFLSSPIYLPFPTFNLGLKALPPLQLIPLYKAIQAVRVEKDISKHKYWMTIHTIGGYLISLQRVTMIVSMSIGWLLAALPKDLHSQIASAFNFPKELDDPRVWEIERSAFSLTAWVAAIWAGLWFWNLLGKKESVVKFGNGKGGNKDL